MLIKDNKCITNFVIIANSCINNTFKMFLLIVLLNTVRKLNEKVISSRIQWQPLVERPIVIQAINLKTDIKWGL